MRLLMLKWTRPWNVIVPLLALLLVLGIACGAPAAQDTDPPGGPLDPLTVDTTPTPTPEEVGDPAEPAEAHGTLDFAWIPMESFQGHPRFADPSRGPYMATTAYESMGWVDADGELGPRLADWSMDNEVWTFNLREGVQFHKGYGEMTADDLIFSLESASASDSVHSRAGQARTWFRAEDGWVERVDDYTVRVHTGQPALDPIIQIGAGIFGHQAWLVSQQQAEELGEEEASRMAAGTGPWEMVSHRTGEFWRFEAVPDHWRKSPNFAEMVFWDIPEESTRVANFQTGQLDSFSVLDLDNLTTLEQVPEVKFMGLPDLGRLVLLLYGQHYVGLGTPEQRPGYDPDLPWVSADPDFESEEWARALMVREALSLAIDRDGIVDAILHGHGRAGQTGYTFSGQEERIPGAGYEYNPDRAQELLAQAGYPDGFSIQLNDHQRGFVGESQACEAISGMWRAIGIDVNYTRIPYASIRPGLVDRSYQGATCMTGSHHISPTEALVGGFRIDAIYNAGFEHPWLEERIEQSRLAQDLDARAAIEDEVGVFMFENFTNMNIYHPETIFPLSALIDEWPLSLNPERRHLTNYEYIPHRP